MGTNFQAAAFVSARSYRKEKEMPGIHAMPGRWQERCLPPEKGSLNFISAACATTLAHSRT
ncbi:hypothetical protein Pan97_43690 [Bremerella volcania]|uniref:Uncharacterized protein n=1 Tax=Bremerella volcania TaxID=2527984 RepID=A0A518CDL7_9BACT|nr:hypothetical protein Pan97_43690 [Bremerella volcania]